MRQYLLAMALGAPVAMADMQYNGFTVDEHLLDAAQKAQFAAKGADSLIEQLKIIEAAALPPEVMADFKKVKILLDPDLKGSPGVFSARGGEATVRLRPIVFEKNKPILLHELLHAYHFAVLSNKNATIAKAYEAASSDGRYPAAYKQSHFLQNDKEYFAVTSTIYLFGNIQQAPFNCSVLAKTDANYLAFLEKLFGPHDCR